MLTDPSGGIGFAFGEILPSADMTTIAVQQPRAIDGGGTGGTYAPSSVITINGSGLTVGGSGFTVTAGGLTVNAAAPTIIAGSFNVTLSAGIFDGGLNVTAGAVVFASGFNVTAGTPIFQAGLTVDGGATNFISTGAVNFNGVGVTASFGSSLTAIEFDSQVFLDAAVDYRNTGPVAVASGVVWDFNNRPDFNLGMDLDAGSLLIGATGHIRFPVAVGVDADTTYSVDGSSGTHASFVFWPNGTLTANRDITLANASDGHIIFLRNNESPELLTIKNAAAATIATSDPGHWCGMFVWVNGGWQFFLDVDAQTVP